MFWEAAPSAEYPEGFASLTLPGALMLNSAHTLERQTWTPEERATLERALAPCTGSTPKYVAL